MTAVPYQKLIHACLTLFQVDAFDGHLLLSGLAIGCLDNCGGSTAWGGQCESEAGSEKGMRSLLLLITRFPFFFFYNQRRNKIVMQNPSRNKLINSDYMAYTSLCLGSGQSLQAGSGSVVESSSLNKVEGLIPAPAVPCQSVLEQDAPTVVQWCMDEYECVSLNWWLLQ